MLRAADRGSANINAAGTPQSETPAFPEAPDPRIPVADRSGDGAILRDCRAPTYGAELLLVCRVVDVFPRGDRRSYRRVPSQRPPSATNLVDPNTAQDTAQT